MGGVLKEKQRRCQNDRSARLVIDETARVRFTLKTNNQRRSKDSLAVLASV